MPERPIPAVKGIISRGEEVLLLKQDLGGDLLWTIPGGRMNFGETPEETLRREIREEVRLDIDIREFLQTYSFFFKGGEKQVIAMVYHCVSPEGTVNIEDSPIEDRIEDYGWFSVPEALDLPLSEGVESVLTSLNSILNRESPTIEEYDKLVRDNIPQIIKDDGETPITEVVHDEKYRRRLRQKLEEEVNEYLESGEAEELADILEVVYALGEEDGCDSTRLEELREKKRENRGGFDRGIVLKKIEK